MTRRNATVRAVRAAVALACSSMLFLSSCSDPAGPGEEADAGIGGEVTFAFLGDGGNTEAWDALFAEFNKAHPEITLNAEGIPSSNWAEYANTVATRLTGGQVIDIVQIATEGQRLFASKGVLEPLEPYFEQDAEFVDGYFEDINPRLREFNDVFMADPDGNVVFVPGGFNTMAMYVNRAVFDAAGVDIPEDGNWTWEEFKSAGLRIKETTGAFLIALNSAYFGTVMPFVTTNGGSTFNEDWSVPTFNTPEVAEAARYLRELVELGLSPEPGGEIDVYAQYAQGNLAIIQGGRWPVLNLRSTDMVDDSVVVNTPFNVENGTPVGWDAWNITKTSKNKDAAWQFIKFMMSQEAGEYFGSVGGTIVPARESVANSSHFTDSAPEFSKRLSDAMSFATAIPSPDRGAEAQQVIEDAWLSILTGQGDIQTVLDNAQRELEELVRE